MKFKKILVGILVTAMAMSMSACGNGQTEMGDEDDTTLSVAIWVESQRAGLEEILSDFTEETGIKTEVSVIGWQDFWTMLDAAARGESLPDVFWMHTNEVIKYMSNGILLDITDRIAESEKLDMTKFPEDVVNTFNWEEKQYGIPQDVNPIALFYNKTLFDEAGVPYPDDTWTYDTLREAAKKLTKDDGSQYGFHMTPNTGQITYFNTIYSMGGYTVNPDDLSSGFDDPNTIRAMKHVEDLIKDGSMPTIEVMSENLSDIMFASGNVAMTMDGSWNRSVYENNEYIVENAGVAMMPKDSETGNRFFTNTSLAWVASASGDNIEESWQLLEYMGTEEVQNKQAEIKMTISAYEGSADLWVSEDDPFDFTAFVDMLDPEKATAVSLPYTRSTIEFTNAMAEELAPLWKGEKTAEEVCADTHAELEEILEREKEAYN